MLEVSLNKVIKNYGFKQILDEFNLEVMTGERIALIGSNGCGKTTLFKLITGNCKANDGIISIRKGATIGLLDQIPTKVADDCQVRKILISGLQEVYAIEEKMREIETKMASCDPNKLNSLLKEYGKLQELFEKVGGYEVEQKINKVCNGFKISDKMLDRTFNSLSGGEKTIINLAALILKSPDILLLDEPTNHLDIDTLEWLEKFLSSYNGTIIISSHDRYFLDQVATKTVLIDKGKAIIFHGNYSYYLKENERRIISEFENYKNQQKQIEAMKNAIKKLREWGKVGDNERFFKRANCIEKRLEKLEKLDKPESKKELPLSFEIEKRSGQDVLISNKIGIILGEKVLFKNATFSITYGERVCLMGKNGSGKSTLIKALLGNINISDGTIKIGSNVMMGYMPQEIEFISDNITVLEFARDIFYGTETQLRATLSKFLFYGENVFKRVGSLSGGEKVRLKLFELIQKKANFLILDEPTNHIDIDTKEILEDALNEYQGTLLFVSHDRYFINKLAQKILHIENNKIETYLGNYDYYKDHLHGHN